MFLKFYGKIRHYISFLHAGRGSCFPKRQEEQAGQAPLRGESKLPLLAGALGERWQHRWFFISPAPPWPPFLISLEEQEDGSLEVFCQALRTSSVAHSNFSQASRA